MKKSSLPIYVIVVIGIAIQIFYIKRLKFQNGLKETEIALNSRECRYNLNLYDFHYKKDPDSVKIIMLGNSLIRHQDWDSLLQRNDIVNRGISGDNLECMCRRLHYLDSTKAKICFIEGGINDLPGAGIDSLVNSYKEMVYYFKKRNIIPVIDLLVYINEKAGEKFERRKDYRFINRKIDTLNQKLTRFAQQENVYLIDLNKKLSDSSGLKTEFTSDGIHLTPAAYNLWATEIKEALKKYGI